MSVLSRNHVTITGRGKQAMIFAHGFGCDQQMWRLVTPAFENDYRIVLFDHVGAGKSDPASYNAAKYATLDGYVTDVLEICDELQLSDVIFVLKATGHCPHLSAPEETIDAIKAYLTESVSRSESVA